MRGTFFLALGAYILIQLSSLSLGSRSKVFEERGLFYQSSAADKTIVTPPFALGGGSAPLHVHSEAGMIPSGGYLALKGNLVNAATQQTTPITLPMTNYASHFEEHQSDVTLPAVPAGKYYLRLDPDAAPSVTSSPINLTVQHGGLFWSNFWMGLAAIGLWPLWVLLRSWSFEKERWMESEFNPYTVSSDDDD